MTRKRKRREARAPDGRRGGPSDACARSLLASALGKIGPDHANALGLHVDPETWDVMAQIGPEGPHKPKGGLHGLLKLVEDEHLAWMAPGDVDGARAARAFLQEAHKTLVRFLGGRTFLARVVELANSGEEPEGKTAIIPEEEATRIVQEFTSAAFYAMMKSFAEGHEKAAKRLRRPLPLPVVPSQSEQSPASGPSRDQDSDSDTSDSEADKPLFSRIADPRSLEARIFGHKPPIVMSELKD